MLMLINKRPYISSAKSCIYLVDVELWVLEEKKKFVFVNRVIESYSMPF